jgi:hypothetical protein
MRDGRVLADAGIGGDADDVFGELVGEEWDGDDDDDGEEQDWKEPAVTCYSNDNSQPTKTTCT